MPARHLIDDCHGKVDESSIENPIANKTNRQWPILLKWPLLIKWTCSGQYLLAE